MDIFRNVVRWFDEQIAVREQKRSWFIFCGNKIERLSESDIDLLFETISHHDHESYCLSVGIILCKFAIYGRAQL